MAKLPALQFYPGDWKKDLGVQSLEFFDRHVWFEMLLLMHDSEERGRLVLNGSAMPDDAIARAIGLDNQTFNQSLTKLLSSGVASREPDRGAIFSRRMVKDEKVRKAHADAGKKGGNPALLNQKPNQTENQKSTPSSSSSTTEQRTNDSRAHEAAHGLTPDMVAHGVMIEASLAGQELVNVLEQIVIAESKRPGYDCTKIRDAMVAAWLDYDANRSALTYPFGATRFFGEGLWKNRSAWPWKQQPSGGATNGQQTNRAERVTASIIDSTEKSIELLRARHGNAGGAGADTAGPDRADPASAHGRAALRLANGSTSVRH